jgi:hypothetical protein
MGEKDPSLREDPSLTLRMTAGQLFGCHPETKAAGVKDQRGAIFLCFDNRLPGGEGRVRGSLVMAM